MKEAPLERKPSIKKKYTLVIDKKDPFEEASRTVGQD